MNKKILNGFTKGFQEVFNPANENTAAFQNALYMFVCILNSEGLAYAVQAPNDFVYIADGVHESIEQFKGIVKRYFNSPMEFIERTSLELNEDFDNYNMAIYDKEQESIYFYGTKEFKNSIYVGGGLEYLFEILFESVVTESGITYFVNDCDASRDFMDILERAFNEYCLKGKSEHYLGYQSSQWSYTQALKNYLTALDDYMYSHE